mgnify:CR=1 FL=1
MSQPSTPAAAPLIKVSELTMAYGDQILQRDLTFTVRKGSIFVVMGDSGCGKSTLLRHLIGLKQPAGGQIFFRDTNFWDSTPNEREVILRRCGVLYQGGALFSSMSVGENVSLPLRQYTRLPAAEIADLVSLKLHLVGLGGTEDLMPSELSGGMRKRAGLARAMALDPEVLFFDEPSAGLDPISARQMDDLILELCDTLGATIILITHELASIFAIGTDAIFLDSKTKTIIGRGHPQTLLDESENTKIIRFLTRGEAPATPPGVVTP